jgi:rubrerythrin
MSADLVRLLEDARRAEKEQALFYRGLASEAEQRDDADLAARFHDLHADEQHHLSRLTARLIEMGEKPADLADVRAGAVDSPGWEAEAHAREDAEIRRYESLLGRSLDEHTRAIVAEVLEVERHHARELGGKWTMA